MPEGSSIKKRRQPHNKPLLEAEDLRAYLREKAAEIAPGDVRTLVSRRTAVQRRALAVRDEHPLLERQVTFAFQLLTDHAKGRCSQIPLHTIAYLTAALFYVLNPFDAIPDNIPGIGSVDDALMLELAFEAAEPGVLRYGAWKNIETDSLFSHGQRRTRGWKQEAP